MVRRRARIRWPRMGAVALGMIAAGLGCELIAGTETRQYSSSSGTSAQDDGGSTGSTSASSGSSGSGGGGGGSGSLWPDSATQYCADGAMMVSCPTSAAAVYHGQDGDTLLNVPTYLPKDTGGGNPTIADNMTGLVWEAKFAAITALPADWTVATMHCETLRNTAYAGLKSWRLPSRRELATLIDAGYTIALFPKEFNALRADAMVNNTFYWTSTTAAATLDAGVPKAWGYWFLPTSMTGVTEIPKTNGAAGRAMCVAGAASAPEPVLSLDGEVVHDTSTGLTWQRAVNATQLSWTDALKHCQALMANAMGGFRLPSVKELLSLIDDSRSAPAIDPSFFPDKSTVKFWSSSPFAWDSTKVWTVNSTNGEATPDDVIQGGPALNKVRCVR